ncbi:MAG TPA: tetratricopeptide repeat protein [Bryobacteraceae bacterium]|nr:tetratricopeptide repeat protein [Bryobacteraceae bacterium]
MLPQIVLFAFLAQAPSPRGAAALVDAGVELLHQEKFNEAAEKFVQAVALDPNLAEAHYLLGLVRQQSGRTDQALSSFRSAVRINPRYAEAQARVCELVTAAAKARETGFEAAANECRRAIALHGNDPESHFHLGWVEGKLGNRAHAMQEHQIVLRLNPKFPGAKYELAMAYLDSQELDSAIPILKEVIAAEPRNANARFQLGAALAKKGDCAAAIPMLETAPDNARTQYVLAGCYKKLNRGEEAESALNKVKKLRAGADARMQAKYRAAAAHKLAEAGKLDEAITEYRAALALVKDPAVAIDLAVALLKKGEPLEVVQLLGQGTDPLERYQVALAYFALKRFPEARTTLESVLRARPEFVEAWYQLGLTWLELGNALAAERSFRRATELRPDEPAFRLAWADTLRQLGRLEEARKQTGLAAPPAK